MVLTITRETLDAIPDPVARMVAEDLIRRGTLRLVEGDGGEQGRPSGTAGAGTVRPGWPAHRR